MARGMSAEEVMQRQSDILYNLYENRVMTLEQFINVGYFKNKSTTKYYFINLEKKGLVKSKFAIIDTKNYKPSKVLYLSYAGFLSLLDKGKKTGDTNLQGIKQYSLASSEMQLRHDINVVDIIVDLVNSDRVDDYKTELFLRREMNRAKKHYRIPDFEFTDKAGKKYIVELELSQRTFKQLCQAMDDYRAYWKEHTLMFVINEPWINNYIKALEHENIKHYEIYVLKDKKLQKIKA
jgi:hypothetical protein